jgi:hypothetical protein
VSWHSFFAVIKIQRLTAKKQGKACLMVISCYGLPFLQCHVGGGAGFRASKIGFPRA